MATIKSVTICKIAGIYGESAAALLRAVSRAHGGFSEFKSIAEDVCSHGADTGVSFIYTHDGAAFFRKYRKVIRAAFTDEAESFGDGYNVLSYVFDFRTLSDFTRPEIAEALFTNAGEYVEQIQCAFAYAAVELAARYVADAADYDD